MNRGLEKSLLLLLSVGIVFVVVAYNTGRISASQFLFAEITFALAVTALLLPLGDGGEMPVLRLPFPLWILPAVVYLVGQVEMFLLRHTSLLYLLTLAGALVLTAFSREKPVKKLAVAIATIGVSHALLYSLYTPSFGNDTWRDAIWAMQTLQTDRITETTIRHSAYPFPMVPLTYTAISLAGGLDPLWSSVVAGFLYLIQLPLLTLLLTRRLVGADDCRGALFLLMTPLAVIWSAWYIPQVYSLALFLTALLAQSSALRYLLLATGVFGHGGVATWMLLNTLVLWIATREKEVGRSLIYLLTVFVTYATYTTLIYALVGGYRNAFEAVLAFLRGDKILAAAAPVTMPPTASLGNLALSVLSVMGLLVFLHGRGALKALAFLSGSLLVISYVGASAFPAADLPRYLGLPTTFMLAVVTPYAFKVLRKRRWGATYFLILTLIAVGAYVYSGVFTPKNPYTANPYFLSLSGLVTRGEVLQLYTISQFLGPGLYLTDLRSGFFIEYRYLFVTPLWQGFKYGDVEFRLGGSYGLYINQAYLEGFRGNIILRSTALDMPEVYDQSALVRIKDTHGIIVYAGKYIEVWSPP